MAGPLEPRPIVEPYYEEVVPTEQVVVEERITEVTDGPGEIWPWLVGLGLVLLLVIGYLALREDDDTTVVTPPGNPTPVQTVVVQQPGVQPPPVIIQQPPAQQAPPQQTVIVQQPPQQQQSSPPAPAPSAS